MEDTNRIESVMDGQPFQAGHHAATLRRFLWREHLGLLPAQDLDSKNDPNAQPPTDCLNDARDNCEEYEFVKDPMSDKLWDMWTGNATKNTDLYRQLFRADPDDNSESCEVHFFSARVTLYADVLASSHDVRRIRAFPA